MDNAFAPQVLLGLSARITAQPAHTVKIVLSDVNAKTTLTATLRLVNALANQDGQDSSVNDLAKFILMDLNVLKPVTASTVEVAILSMENVTAALAGPEKVARRNATRGSSGKIVLSSAFASNRRLSPVIPSTAAAFARLHIKEVIR